MKNEKISVLHSKNSQGIIQATKSLMHEKPYQEISVRDICERAGVSRSSFYSVFAGKDDVIIHMVRSLKEDSASVLNRFIKADNDLERIWSLYDTYLSVGLEFGPDAMATLLALDMHNSIGFIEQFYLYNEWFCTLVKNCQQKGIIRNTDDSKSLVDAAVFSAFGIVFEWCRRNGDFDLREQSFLAHEAIYDVSPEYRGLWKK